MSKELMAKISLYKILLGLPFVIPLLIWLVFPKADINMFLIGSIFLGGIHYLLFLLFTYFYLKKDNNWIFEKGFRISVYFAVFSLCVNFPIFISIILIANDTNVLKDFVSFLSFSLLYLVFSAFYILISKLIVFLLTSKSQKEN